MSRSSPGSPRGGDSVIREGMPTVGLKALDPDVGDYNDWRETRTAGGTQPSTGIGSVSTHLFVGAGDYRPVNAVSSALVGDANAGHGVLATGPYAYNATTFDHYRNNVEKTLLANAARGAGTSSAQQTAYNAVGLSLTFPINARTVGGSPLIRVDIQKIDPIASGGDYIQSPSFDPILGTHNAMFGRGVSGAAITGTFFRQEFNLAGILPRIYRITIVYVSDVTDLTYSMTVSEVLA